MLSLSVPCLSPVCLLYCLVIVYTASRRCSAIERHGCCFCWTCHVMQPGSRIQYNWWSTAIALCLYSAVYILMSVYILLSAVQSLCLHSDFCGIRYHVYLITYECGGDISPSLWYFPATFTASGIVCGIASVYYAVYQVCYRVWVPCPSCLVWLYLNTWYESSCRSHWFINSEPLTLFWRDVTMTIISSKVPTFFRYF